MYHFYTDRSNIYDDHIVISGPDVNHIRNVLRMREGEELIICDKEGTDHYCRIREFSDGNVIADIEKRGMTEAELPSKVYLFQGLPKKDKMELIIQKAVELGAYEIVPVMTKRVIVKLDDPKKEAKKVERWNLIAEAAAKQSGRGLIPRVTDCVSFKDALKLASSMDKRLIPYENADSSKDGMENARELIRGLKGAGSICVFIGPEGGFEESEVEAAVAAGFDTISLGKRILRTETAGLTVLSVIMFVLD